MSCGMLVSYKIWMEKIVLVVDALEPNQHVFEFACYLGHLTKSKKPFQNMTRQLRILISIVCDIDQAMLCAVSNQV
jgi:hypothetical protein